MKNTLSLLIAFCMISFLLLPSQKVFAKKTGASSTSIVNFSQTITAGNGSNHQMYGTIDDAECCPPYTSVNSWDMHYDNMHFTGYAVNEKNKNIIPINYVELIDGVKMFLTDIQGNPIPLDNIDYTAAYNAMKTFVQSDH